MFGGPFVIMVLVMMMMMMTVLLATFAARPLCSEKYWWRKVAGQGYGFFEAEPLC